jgi:hypothetical protein
MDRQRKSLLLQLLVIIELAFIIITGTFITSSHPFIVQTLPIWGILFLIVTLLAWTYVRKPST